MLGGFYDNPPTPDKMGPLRTNTGSVSCNLSVRKPDILGLQYNRCPVPFPTLGMLGSLTSKMADDSEQNLPATPGSDHETRWKVKYFTLLKHCRQTEQVKFYYIESKLVFLILLNNVFCVEKAINIPHILKLIRTLT